MNKMTGCLETAIESGIKTMKRRTFACEEVTNNKYVERVLRGFEALRALNFSARESFELIRNPIMSFFFSSKLYDDMNSRIDEMHINFFL